MDDEPADVEVGEGAISMVGKPSNTDAVKRWVDYLLWTIRRLAQNFQECQVSTKGGGSDGKENTSSRR